MSVSASDTFARFVDVLARALADDGLSVALEAGYSSHEAFTRAFRRSFGDAPSRWRGRAAQFRLPAPSGVHFQPPGGLRVPAQRKVTAMQLLTRLVEHHVWLVG